MSRIVPHIRGERGCVFSHSSSSLDDFIQFEGLFSLFFAVERYTCLRIFLYYFGSIDFFIQI